MATVAFGPAAAWSLAQKAEGSRGLPEDGRGRGVVLTSISSPSLVSSLVQEVLGPSPFRSLCSQTILFSLSHFTKLCKRPEAKWVELTVRANANERRQTPSQLPALPRTPS